MDLDQLKRLAFSRHGLSANFEGSAKQKKIMQENFNFEFKVKNDTTNDVVYAITKGSFPGLAELNRSYANVNCIAMDGIMLTDPADQAKTVNMQVFGNKSFKHFQDFFDKTAGVITDLEINSPNKRNFGFKVFAVGSNPFTTPSPYEIKLSQFVSLNQNDSTRMIAEKIDIPLNGLTVVMFTIAANSEADIAFTVRSLNASRN